LDAHVAQGGDLQGVNKWTEGKMETPITGKYDATLKLQNL